MNMFLYCRSLGMLKEAEIIEQQMLAARSQPQPDYSAQWADYYRYRNTFNTLTPGINL